MLTELNVHAVPVLRIPGRLTPGPSTARPDCRRDHLHHVTGYGLERANTQ
jgi:hypothetical protein